MTKWRDDDWERKQKARNPKQSNRITLNPAQMYRNLTPREIIRSEQGEIWEYNKMGEDIDSI